MIDDVDVAVVHHCKSFDFQMIFENVSYIVCIHYSIEHFFSVYDKKKHFTLCFLLWLVGNHHHFHHHHRTNRPNSRLEWIKMDGKIVWNDNFFLLLLLLLLLRFMLFLFSTNNNQILCFCFVCIKHQHYYRQQKHYFFFCSGCLISPLLSCIELCCVLNSIEMKWRKNFIQFFLSMIICRKKKRKIW